MRPNSHNHFPWRIFVFALLIASVWWVLTKWGGWSANLAESNLQANLIRITRYLRADSPDAVLVGSSVSGRLLPQYFQHCGQEVYNLGLDGSGPLFAFEILSQSPRRPKLVFLEADTLFRPLSGNDKVLREAMHSTTAMLSRRVPFLRPELRPLTVVYATLKSLRESSFQGKRLPPCVATGNSPALPKNYSWVRDKVAELKQQGIRMLLVNMPDGEGWAMPLSGPGRQLADELDLEVVEPGVDIFREQGDVLRFSDGVHLDGPSAQKVSEYLALHLRPPAGSP